MPDMKTGIVLLGAALVLAGCGSSASVGSASSPSATPSPTPVPVESASCRSTVATMGQIADVMETSTGSAAALSQRVAKVRALQKTAGAECSQETVKPLLLAAYKFALADAGYTICTNAQIFCDQDKIARQTVAGAELVKRAVTLSTRTQ